MSDNRRRFQFIALLLLTVLGSALYLGLVVKRRKISLDGAVHASSGKRRTNLPFNASPPDATARPVLTGNPVQASEDAPASGGMRTPREVERALPAHAKAGLAALLFRNTAAGDKFGKATLAALEEGSDQSILDFDCERLHYASGFGVCLAVDPTLTAYSAEIFDHRFRRLHEFPLTGLPSRVRVSPDGRLAAITVFVSGHGYAQVGFSTRTTIVETASGRQIAELEQFSVTRDGSPFKEQDFNFWGVTFTRDSRHFFATLRTGWRNYLVKGAIDSRSMTVVTEGVECPSISPDNSRIAFKFRKGSLAYWRLEVLNVASLERNFLAETRNVDDQVEWLDNDRILYAIPASEALSPRRMDVWVVRADGTGSPQKFRDYASSPAVIRLPGDFR